MTDNISDNQCVPEVWQSHESVFKSQTQVHSQAGSNKVWVSRRRNAFLTTL